MSNSSKSGKIGERISDRFQITCCKRKAEQLVATQLLTLALAFNMIMVYRLQSSCPLLHWSLIPINSLFFKYSARKYHCSTSGPEAEVQAAPLTKAPHRSAVKRSLGGAGLPNGEEVLTDKSQEFPPSGDTAFY